MPTYEPSNSYTMGCPPVRGDNPPALARGLSFVLFDLILYVPSTIFQLYRDGSSWVEPVLS